jgi:hypothetical protein
MALWIVARDILMTAAIPTLPSGPLDLLVKAALAPEADARAAWQEWRRGYALDETPWNEVRLLGAVADRIAWLEPTADISPRIKGIQKFLYAQSQICLTGCMGGVAALTAAQVPVMAMKGAARVMADGRMARERLVRDLDVLVPLPQAAKAYDCLVAAGWSLKESGPWQNFWRQLDPVANHHAWSLAKGKGEIDLHHFSNSLNRLEGDDDGLWQRSAAITWRGMEIRVPAPADGLLLSIVHGLRWSRECNADWMIDACACLDGEEIDWAVLLEEAEARKLDAILLTGLRYVKDSLARAIPAEVIATLSARATAAQWDELAVYAAVPLPMTMAQNRPLAEMAIERSGSDRSGTPAKGRFNMPAESLPKRFSIDIDGLIRDEEQALLAVRLPVAAPTNAQPVGVLCLMGLIIAAQPGVFVREDGGRLILAFDFSLPCRLLRRRGASKLLLTVGVPGAMLFPPWKNVG